MINTIFSSHPRAYTRGLPLYRQQQWQAARAHFERAVRARPGHADSHFKLGMCLFREQDFDGAIRCIEQAMHLAPGRTEWNRQLQQARRNARRADDSASKQGDAGKGNDELVRLLQSYLLAGDYAGFARLLDQYVTLLGVELPQRVNIQVGLLRCEAALMGNDDTAFAAALAAFPPGASERGFPAARHQLKTGRVNEAIAELQYCRERTPAPEVDYLLAGALARQGEKTAAWALLTAVLQRSRRTETWQYLADMVASPGDLTQYLAALETWAKSSPLDRQMREVASASAEAALRAGNGRLARRIWHDCVQAHAERKGGARTMLPNTLRHATRPGLPLWLNGFQDLPTASATDMQGRARQAVGDLNVLIEQHALEIFPVNATRQWIRQGGQSPLSCQYLDYIVVGTAPMARLLSGDTPFADYQAKGAGAAQILVHANGVRLRLINMAMAEDGASIEDHGVRWSLPAPIRETVTFAGQCFTLPGCGHEDVERYGCFATSCELLSAIAADRIVDADRLACHGYAQLLEAMLSDDDTLERAAIRVLRLLDEPQADYQQLLKGNFILPDLERLIADAPQVVLHISGLENVGYQANMWIPVLERLDARCAVVIREKRTAEELIPTALPVYLIRNLRELEWLEEAGVRTVLYPGNAQMNSQVMRMHRLNHFFINHGESDKVVNQSKFLMAYDQLLMAGPLAERRLRASGLPVRDNQVVHVGRPQVELSLERVTQPARRISRILYAPTWEGFVEEANYSSVSAFGLEMMKALAGLENVEVFFKPHPYTGYNKSGPTGQYLDEIKRLVAASRNMTYVGFGENIHDWMNRSDLLITDISSVLNDYLHTLKPIVLAGVGQQPPVDLFEQYPSSRAAYLLEQGNDVTGLIEAIERDDRLLETRAEVCRDSLGDFPEGSLARFNAVVMRSLNAGPASAPSSRLKPLLPE